MMIDAHVHLPIGDGCNSLQEKKERLLYEMDINQVSQCIVISDSYIKSPIGSMDECVTLFENTDNVHVVGGISPFVEFHTQFMKLRRYLNERKIIGIKLFTGHEDFYLTDDRLKEVYELAIHYDVPLLFHSGWDNSQYSDVDVAETVAKKYPELKWVCCHCFYPNIHKCKQLIKYPNIYFDISSIADDKTIREQISVEVKELIYLVPDRVLFGSDAFGCSQEEHLAFVKELPLSSDMEYKFFWENANHVYRL